VFEEPLPLTNLSPTDDRFARRSLQGTTVTVYGQDVVLDSGCEAKLVLSRRFADGHWFRHRSISRVVGLPDGSRIAASTTEPILLAIAGSSEVSAIVVEMVAFDCILGLPWLQDVNQVMMWEQMTLLLPTDHGQVDVDMSSDPCRSGLPTPTLLTVAQLQEVAKGGDPVSLVTLKETRGPRGPVSPPI
jgi:Retroviral aspartyl protease